MMGKSFSRTRSDNEGTEEVDQSRRLEVGLVNFDSHKSVSGLGWYEVMEVIGFILMLLYVVWEARKYCTNRSFTESVIRYLPGQNSGSLSTASNIPQIPTDNRCNWIPAPPRLNTQAIEMSPRIQVLQTATGPVESVGTVPAGDYTTWRGAQ